MQKDLRTQVSESAHLVGITTGGAWLAEQLQADWKRPSPWGVVSSSMHRDDYAKRGLSESVATRLPFAVDGAVIWLIDDVLFTGRTIRDDVLNDDREVTREFVRSHRRAQR